MADKYIKVDENTVGIPTEMPTMTRDKIVRHISRLVERIAEEQERLEDMKKELSEYKKMLTVLDKE